MLSPISLYEYQFSLLLYSVILPSIISTSSLHSFAHLPLLLHFLEIYSVCHSTMPFPFQGALLFPSPTMASSFLFCILDRVSVFSLSHIFSHSPLCLFIHTLYTSLLFLCLPLLLHFSNSMPLGNLHTTNSSTVHWR